MPVKIITPLKLSVVDNSPTVLDILADCLTADNRFLVLLAVRGTLVVGWEQAAMSRQKARQGVE